MNANIKNNHLHNGNPEINPAAKPLFTLGNVQVGDTVYKNAHKYVVVQTGIRVQSEERLYKHAIKVESVENNFIDILTNEKENEDFSGIWE